jgi:hypothetical protein
MDLNNILKLSSIFSNFFMDDLYEINYQFNGRFCKIHIHYNSIDHLSSVDHL